MRQVLCVQTGLVRWPSPGTKSARSVHETPTKLSAYPVILTLGGFGRSSPNGIVGRFGLTPSLERLSPSQSSASPYGTRINPTGGPPPAW